MRDALPSLRTPTLLRRRTGSGFVATTHSSALAFLGAMIMIAVFACNLRFFTRAFMSSVPRGVYRTEKTDDDEHDSTRGGVLAALPLLARRDPENGAAGLRPLEEDRLLAESSIAFTRYFIGRRGKLARFFEVAGRWTYE